MHVLRRRAGLLATPRRLTLAPRPSLVARGSTVAASTSSEVDIESERFLFLDSIFPVRLGKWESVTTLSFVSPRH
jgi:hypothetical protein